MEEAGQVVLLLMRESRPNEAAWLTDIHTTGKREILDSTLIYIIQTQSRFWQHYMCFPH